MPLWPGSQNNPVNCTDKVRQLHKDAVPTADSAVTATAPGVWSLIGEHTDYYGGVVLLCHSEQELAVALSPRPDNEIVVRENILAYDPTTAAFTEQILESSCSASDVPDSVSSQAQLTALRVAGLIFSMTNKQMLSREVQGFTVTTYSTIPRDPGLGYFAAFDTAVALALGHSLTDITTAPMQAKLADVCFQAALNYSAIPPLRSQYTACLRGSAEHLNVIDYADGSITHASNPVSATAHMVALAISTPQLFSIEEHQGEITKIKEQHEFLEQATRAFGASSLRALPDAATRVTSWLEAVHEVNGPEGVPPVAEASQWLRFFEVETEAACEAAQAIRARRNADLFPLLTQSNHNLSSLAGLGSPQTTALVRLCQEQGAESVRLAEAGLSDAVIAMISSDSWEDYADSLSDMGLQVCVLGGLTKGE